MDETLIKNIVKEIHLECSNRGLEVGKAFIAYYVRLLILDPQWDLISKETNFIQREPLQNFIKFVLGRLQFKSCPSLMTLRMQRYFTCSFDNPHLSAAVSHRQELREKLLPLENEILDVDEALTNADAEKLYKKIVFYTTLLKGLGNPTVSAVYKEAYAALHSIFTTSDLDDFFALDRDTKLQFLVELADLVMGIRLFNRNCQKGGKGIDDMPTMLESSLRVGLKEFQRTLLEVMQNINALTTAVDRCFTIEEKTNGYYLCCDLPSGVDVDSLDFVKDTLVFHRQYEVYIRRFMEILKTKEIEIKEVNDEHAVAMQEIHDICKYRTAIPTNLIFPAFIKLAKIWSRLQDEVLIVANINNVYLNIDNLFRSLDLRRDVIEKMLEGHEALDDGQRLQITPELEARLEGYRKILVDPASYKDYSKLPLQYLGFCAWKFVETNGALIPGNQNMGVVYYAKKYFVFSVLEAAIEFAKEPERYVREGIEILRKKPDLINVLQMYDTVNAAKDIKDIVIQPRELLVVHNTDTQTLDEDRVAEPQTRYMWNVWDWRRQAIILANISRSVTKSVQTDKAGSRGNVRVQTHEMRTKLLQTKKDNYANHATLSNFIYGLRGRKDDKQFIITLTRPIEEKPECKKKDDLDKIPYMMIPRV